MNKPEPEEKKKRKENLAKKRRIPLLAQIKFWDELVRTSFI